jgi:Outer membrane protein
MITKKYLNIILCILFGLSLMIATNLIAQEKNVSSYSDNDYSTFKLPPIDTLYAHVSESPHAKYYEQRIVEAQTNLKTEKFKWLKYINVNAGYQYGYLGGQYITGTETSSYYQSNQNATNYYHVGANISIPFDEIFDKKNRVRNQKAIINQNECERQAFVQGEQLKVAEFYYRAKRCLALFQEVYTTTKLYKSTLDIAQQDFINGKIDVSQLSQIRKTYTDELDILETLRSNLYLNLSELEIISNYKFIKQ